MPTSVMVIVLVSVIGGLIYAAYEQHIKLQMKTKKSSHEVELEKELAELKERVAVLEKIVTDDKYDLKNEINNLNKAS